MAYLIYSFFVTTTIKRFIFLKLKLYFWHFILFHIEWLTTKDICAKYNQSLLFLFSLLGRRPWPIIFGLLLAVSFTPATTNATEEYNIPEFRSKPCLAWTWLQKRFTLQKTDCSAMLIKLTLFSAWLRHFICGYVLWMMHPFQEWKHSYKHPHTSKLI